MEDDRTFEDYRRNVEEGGGYLQESIRRLISDRGIVATLDVLVTMTFALAVTGDMELNESVDQVVTNTGLFGDLIKESWDGTDVRTIYREWFDIKPMRAGGPNGGE